MSREEIRTHFGVELFTAPYAARRELVVSATIVTEVGTSLASSSAGVLPLPPS
jgi:hypothetical protein